MSEGVIFNFSSLSFGRYTYPSYILYMEAATTATSEALLGCRAAAGLHEAHDKAEAPPPRPLPRRRCGYGSAPWRATASGSTRPAVTVLSIKQSIQERGMHSCMQLICLGRLLADDVARACASCLTPPQPLHTGGERGRRSASAPWPTAGAWGAQLLERAICRVRLPRHVTAKPRPPSMTTGVQPLVMTGPRRCPARGRLQPRGGPGWLGASLPAAVPPPRGL